MGHASRREKPANKGETMRRLFPVVAIIAFVFVLIGGCVRLKYWAFKQKFPNAGVWSFIISGSK